MRVLVTGSEGLVGSILIPALREAGHEVVGYDAKHRQDVHDERGLLEAIKGAEAVVHLAAIPHPFRRGDYDLINRQGTLAVVNAAEKVGVTHFVYFSSSDVYGFCGGPSQSDPPPAPPITENDVDFDHLAVCAYAGSKYAGEQHVLDSEIPCVAIFRLESPSPPTDPDPQHYGIVCSHETMQRAVLAALAQDLLDGTLVANLADPNPAYDTARLQELIGS